VADPEMNNDNNTTKQVMAVQ